MRAVNHIAGGFVFTGIFASLWNINVFGSGVLFATTAVASILPDIDHTRSLLGKMFYPVSRYIDRQFGHRTITHSLLFLGCVLSLSLYLEHLFSDNYHFSVVIFFAVLSHFILDMVTVQGIPLFYPFAKNPCVIPGNPAYRIRSSNKQAELVAFAIFILIGACCINLFQHGFWTSYNRAFGTVKHLHRENRSSNNLIQVDYHFIRNGVEKKGTGILVDSKYENATLFDKEIIHLDEMDVNTKIISVIPSQLPFKKESREISFFNISLDSLYSLCRDKIITGQIQSSEPVEFFENNIKRRSSLFKLENAYQFTISFVPDSLRSSLQDKLKIKELTLERTRSSYNQKLHELEKIRLKYDQHISDITGETDLYRKNNLQTEIIKLRSQITSLENRIDSFLPDPVLVYEIQSLKQQMITSKSVSFSGVVSYLVMP